MTLSIYFIGVIVQERLAVTQKRRDTRCEKSPENLGCLKHLFHILDKLIEKCIGNSLLN